ncbi:SHD1 domain-containing protein, partial [Crocinitomicaceae bacterium]|nr:SHD1 domain-containing protein [Crocinitomicaceae bacterium]
ATFVDFQNDRVRLKRQDDKIITVPIARLSQADRSHLAQLKLGQRDSGMKKTLPSSASGSSTLQVRPQEAKTGKCRFEVSGLLHAKRGSMQGDCMDCWNVIKAEGGCSELRRHISTCWSGQLEHSTGLRWQISTYPQFSLSTDLATIAKAVTTAKTPHRTPRSFFALLYATPKANQTKVVQPVLAKLPGVDARQSAVDKKGIIRVKISGQKPIRLPDIVAAMQEAGIQVATSRGRRE